MAEEHRKTLPLARIATPEDIADVVAFFAGPDSRHVTGETLLADGGLHLTAGQTDFR
jgi:NAD(P)-dependent dehydrogenase (short-subunit alcohol dehydrogenase family)